MKYTQVLILLLSAVVGHLVAAQPSDSLPGTQPLSLKMCLDYAFKNNANVGNAELERLIAQRDVSVTKTQGFPQINASAGYVNNFILQTSLIDPSGFPGFGEGDPNNPGPTDDIEVQFGIAHQVQAGVSVSQLIFDGSYFVGLKAAKVYTDLTKKSLDQTKVATAEQVTKAYYTALVNQARQALLNSNYQRLDTLLRETQAMFDNGFAEKIDVGRVRVQFNNAKTERDQNERLTEISYLLLKFQMGMPIDQDIALADKISDITFDDKVGKEAEFTYSDRIEYAQVLVNQELNRLDMRNNRVQYFPKLTANAGYGYNSGASQFSKLTNFGDRWFDYGNWGINLSIPIFDGLQKHHLIQKNKLQLQQLENQAEFLENQIDLEIVQARVNLQNNRDMLTVQQENLELAKEIFDVTKIKYQEGVGANLEVTEAQNALQQAETNFFNALYNALIAQVDLQKALGTLVDDTITE